MIANAYSYVDMPCERAFFDWPISDHINDLY